MKANFVSPPRRIRRTPCGFTLLELIIVLVVLVALAGLVVPTLGFIRDQANFATSAAGSAQVMNNLEIFKASTGNYPGRFDSLVGTDGAAYEGVWNHGDGSPFQVLDLSSAAPGSPEFNLMMAMAHGGPSSVVDHVPDAANPNESTVGQPARNSWAGPLATINPMSTSSLDREIIRTVFPVQADPATPAVPANHQLVVMGVGPQTTAVGATMAGAPVHADASDGTYGRYLAIFDVNLDTRKCQLAMVVDSRRASIASRVQDYRESEPDFDEGEFVAPDPD